MATQPVWCCRLPNHECLRLCHVADWWTTLVSTGIEGLDKTELEGIYANPKTDDPHQCEDKTRAIWKYGASKGVSGTPTAFINGVQLDSFPADSKAWLDLFNELQAIQWTGDQTFLQ